MNSERNILKRLYENCTFEDDTLDEKTYTVGDTQYWKRGGKTYKWTQSGGRQECSEDEYYKALSGGTSGNDKVNNTDPVNDKARDTDVSSAKVGDTKTLGDWSYTKVGNDSWETTYKGKKQPNRTDADIKRVFSGADHDSQPKKESPYSKYGFTKKPTEKMVGSIAGKYIIGDEARDITYVLTDRNGKMAMNII